MLTPTVANRTSFLYAAGNTPATNLARCIPQEQDAAILSLGSGDLRNILYTAYIDKGLPQRRLDFTCCDIDEKIVARNILLLTLILDRGDKVTDELLWNVYYHLYVDSQTVALVAEQTNKLISISKTLEDWVTSVYGRAIKFCDQATLQDARRIWTRVKREAEKCQADAEGQLKAFRKVIKVSDDLRNEAFGAEGINLTGLRSAAPLSLQSQQDLPVAFKQYWKDGTVTPRPTGCTVPNPLLAGIVSETEALHYGNDPVLGYHLATAYAPLAENSPLKPGQDAKEFPAAAAAKVQFFQWLGAFRLLFGKKLVVRYINSDALMFCHALQSASKNGKPAHLFRRQWDTRELILDPKIYGRGGSAPTKFDMIDTSNLGDHFGVLNILIAAGALLRDEPWATLVTELLIKRGNNEREVLEKLLCGDTATVSLFLGLSPVQFWTNAKCESHVDEIFIGLIGRSSVERETQFRSRIAWKRDDRFSGYAVGRSRLQMDASDVARICAAVHHQMFEGEDMTKSAKASAANAYPHFHRGSFATFLKVVQTRVKTEWLDMCAVLLDKIGRDETLMLTSNHLQDLCLQLHMLGVNTEPWILNEIRKTPDQGSFNCWKTLPPAVAVTMAVPREAINRLYTGSKIASLPLVGSIRSSPNGSSQWHNMISDVQITFGNIKQTKSRTEDGFTITIEEDKEGWAGTSHLIASFYVPTASLQVEPKTALIGLCIPPNIQTSQLYGPILGTSMAVFETKMEDESKVYVTKYLPGHTSYPVLCAAVAELDDAVNKGQDDKTVKYSASSPASSSAIETITGRVDITSKKGRDLLKEKVPIELRQDGPFALNIVFGDNQLVSPIRYPVPVTKEGSRTRIARTTGYIEVIAPLIKTGVSDVLGDFVYPTALSSSGPPATLNTTHLNLDNLPVLDLGQKDRIRFLTTLTSLQFSPREKRLREETDAEGISNDPRVNFKESLFTMFMVASGLQGGQTGMFAINHPGQGGIHMLLFVSAIKIDGDAASVVLDAAVIPFTTRLIESGKMESFLLLIRELECCTLNVNDAELALWKSILPSLVERCRTWTHASHCEYKRKKATIPLSLKHGEAVICSCGNGHLPDNFVTLPEWDVAAPNAVRIAISPTYAVPFVEEVVDTREFDQNRPVISATERCRNCGKTEGPQGAALKKCTRCLEAKYCSAECQKKDWKKHRMECKDSA